MVRTARLAIASFLVLAALPEPCLAAATASDTIRSFYGVLLSVMKNASSLGPKGRYEKLEPVVGQTFDIPYMTRAAVGPAWTSLAGAKQEEVTKAFWRYIAATYADRFNSYSGQDLRVTGEQRRASGTVVDSRIVKSDGSSVAIRYLMHQDAGNWRVADVYLSSGISELATRRSEFSSIISREGIDGVITTLNRKADTFAHDRAR